MLMKDACIHGIYDTMSGVFYWTHMVNDDYATVHDYQSCAINHQTSKRQRKLRLFSPNGPLELAAINILGRIPRTKTIAQHAVALTLCYFNLTREIETVKITAIAITTIHVNYWILSDETPVSRLTDNGPKFASRLL